jgi:ferredoxin-NADP reductase
VSTWLLDEVGPGDVLELTRPAGVFTLRERTAPIVAFSGGSGITPVISLIKSALATTSRPVRLLYANRGPDSVIFGAELDAMSRTSAGRFAVVHHLDRDQGFVHSDIVSAFVGSDLDADFYICGPAPFMDVVEDALVLAHVQPEQVFVERFAFASTARLDRSSATSVDATDDADGGGATATVVIVLDGREHEVRYQAGETFLETARRAGLRAPFSCESGSCATCMARLKDGQATMRVNNALTPEEVTEGWVLTCQGLPTSPTATVVYEP